MQIQELNPLMWKDLATFVLEGLCHYTRGVPMWILSPLAGHFVCFIQRGMYVFEFFQLMTGTDGYHSTAMLVKQIRQSPARFSPLWFNYLVTNGFSVPAGRGYVCDIVPQMPSDHVMLKNLAPKFAASGREIEGT